MKDEVFVREFFQYSTTKLLNLEHTNMLKDTMDHNDIINCTYIPISCDWLCGISFIIIFTFFSALDVLGLVKYNKCDYC